MSFNAWSYRPPAPRSAGVLARNYRFESAPRAARFRANEEPGDTLRTVLLALLAAIWRFIGTLNLRRRWLRIGIVLLLILLAWWTASSIGTQKTDGRAQRQKSTDRLDGDDGSTTVERSKRPQQSNDISSPAQVETPRTNPWPGIASPASDGGAGSAPGGGGGGDSGGGSSSPDDKSHRQDRLLTRAERLLARTARLEGRGTLQQMPRAADPAGRSAPTLTPRPMSAAVLTPRPAFGGYAPAMHNWYLDRFSNGGQGVMRQIGGSEGGRPVPGFHRVSIRRGGGGGGRRR